MTFVRGFASAMSEVISFRLNKDNLREAQALLILQDWRAKGYNFRQTITEALIKLEAAQEEQPTIQFNDLNDALYRVNQLLEKLGNRDSSQNMKTDRYRGNSRLSDQFIVSIKKSAKNGMKIR